MVDKIFRAWYILIIRLILRLTRMVIKMKLDDWCKVAKVIRDLLIGTAALITAITGLIAMIK